MRAPAVFCALVTGLLLVGAYDRFAPPGLDQALATLRDGVPDRAERLRCLRVVLARSQDKLLRASCALQLEDREAYARCLPLDLERSDPAVIHAASFEEPAVAWLLLGDKPRAARAARLSGLTLVAELAR